MRWALLCQHRHMQLQMALQEWALVCQQLAEGSCSVLLRKGGIHDRAGLFEPSHSQFLLLPSFLHQDPTRLRRLPAQPLEAMPDQHRLAIWAEVTNTWRVEDLDVLLAAATGSPASLPWPWSATELEKRFSYRDKPFLYVMLVRCYHLKTEQIIADSPQYAGCKSWLKQK